MKNKLFVISLGGSLINPGEVNVIFLKKFKALLESEIKKGCRFILVTGGGKLCRDYQSALSKIIKPKTEDLDWLGVHSTRFHANFLSVLFGKLAKNEIFTDPTKKINLTKPITLAAGWKPGWSTDYDAVLLARNYGADTVINLTDVDYAYTKNPKKFPDAVKIEHISWTDFRKIVGNVWNPGINVPFDPVASKLALHQKLKVIIANGQNLSNLKNILEGKKFIGTEIV